MDLLTRAFRNARREVRSAEFGDSSIPPNSALAGFSGSGYIDEQSALTISTVLACLKALYDDMCMPFAAYQGSKNGARSPIAKQPMVVSQPFGPDMPRAVGFGQIRVSVAMRGNAYLAVTSRDQDGFPTSLQVLHPDKVQVKLDQSGRKVFRVNQQPWVNGENVKHLMGMSMPGMIEGLDPISYMRVSLQLADDVAQYGANFFKNGAAPSGVISVKGPGTAKNAREVKEAWEAGHSGVNNAHRPAVLFGGAEWKPMSITPENAQFLETRSFSREEICGWFGVPLQRIQAIVQHASQGGGKGLDTIEQGYATHTLVPPNTQLEELWDTFIPGDQTTWTRFDYSQLLRASAVERATIASIHRLGGVRNRNEIRAEEGWAPIPGPDGADYNIPLNSSTSIPPLLDEGQEPPASDTPPDGGTN